MNNRIYISGPITGIDNYKENFAKAEIHLINNGYESKQIINPVRFNALLPDNLFHYQYMFFDITLLKMCDSIYMLKGWEKSAGANEEYEYAKRHNIKIIYEK